MGRWDNDTYAADEWKTSDGRTFGTRGEADRHQDELDEQSSSSPLSFHTSGSSGLSRTPDYWMNEEGKKAYALYEKGRYDEAIALCDKALKHYNVKNWNRDNIIGYVFTVRGVAYKQKGMREKAILDLTEGADYGSSSAKEILAKEGVAYTPKRPSTYREYHPDYDDPRFIVKPASKDKDDILHGPNAIFAGIPFGIGLMFTAGWVYLQVTGAERLERIPALVVLAAATLVTALFIHLKKWIVVILLALLAVAGYLVLFGVIPEHLNKGEAVTTAYESAAPAQTSIATVISDALNFRAEASGGAAVVKTLKKGDTLTVTGENADGWTPVEHEGDTGWVSSEFLERS